MNVLTRVYLAAMLHNDSINCGHAHFGPFNPHITRNEWHCSECGSEVTVGQLMVAFTIQLRILDIQQAALKSARTQRDLI